MEFAAAGLRCAVWGACKTRSPNVRAAGPPCSEAPPARRAAACSLRSARCRDAARALGGSNPEGPPEVPGARGACFSTVPRGAGRAVTLFDPTTQHRTNALSVGPDVWRTVATTFGMVIERDSPFPERERCANVTIQTPSTPGARPPVPPVFRPLGRALRVASSHGPRASPARGEAGRASARVLRLPHTRALARPRPPRPSR